jgi:hypothetical protein
MGHWVSAEELAQIGDDLAGTGFLIDSDHGVWKIRITVGTSATGQHRIKLATHESHTRHTFCIAAGERAQA